MIMFSTDFPCGNGCLLASEQKDDFQEITFRAETKFKEPQPNWFYFRVSGLNGSHSRFILANAEQCLDDHGVIGWRLNRPVYRVPDGEWQRVEQVQAELQPNRCFKVWFDIHTQSNELDIAYCYPYDTAQLKKTLCACPRLRSDVIGYSHNGREILRVSNDYGSEIQEKKGVYLVARQHAAEVSGGWVTDGILRFLQSDEGQRLTQDMVWWLVPIIDPDGVEEGAYGKDQVIGDFNRSWGAPFPNRVELHAVQHDMDHLAQFSRPALFLDMHSPGNDVHGIELLLKEEMNCQQMTLADRVGLWYNEYLQQNGLQESLIKHKPLGANTSAKTGMMSAVYASSRAGVPAITVETSCWGPRGSVSTYSVADYHKMGECMVKAVVKALE